MKKATMIASTAALYTFSARDTPLSAVMKYSSKYSTYESVDLSNEKPTHSTSSPAVSFAVQASEKFVVSLLNISNTSGCA